MRHLHFSRLARLDWLLLFLLNFPVPLYELCRSQWDMGAFLQFFLATAGFVLLIICLAVFIDAFRGYLAPQSSRLDANTLASLRVAINEQNIDSKSLKLNRLEVVPSDLTMGAHVRGVLWPRIVISGGMLMGLLMKDPRADAILSHERSHINHLDRYLPGLIGLAIFEVVGTFLKFSMENANDPSFARSELLQSALALVAYKVFVLGGFVSAFSHYREYYADAAALASTNVPASYLALLESCASAEKSHASLFHPSFRARLKQARNGSTVLRRMLFWRGYLVVAGIVSLTQYLFLDGGFIEKYALASSLAFGAVLMGEIMRVPLLKVGEPLNVRRQVSKAPHPEKCRPQETRQGGWSLIPIIVLLFGFIFVLIVGDIFAPGDTTVRAIGGGIVYVIYRSLREKGK